MMEDNKVDSKTALDLERKKKKEDKIKEKELKRLRALEKAAAAAANNKPQKVTATAGKKKAVAKKDDAVDETPEDYIDPPTNPGEKKHLSRQMAKEYSPAAVEKSWYPFWEESGFFTADASSTKPAFAIVLPPPNVTGTLHNGHGLTIALQDTLVRYKRMSGHNVCWVPGMDHAGIATQVVVEKKIMRESNRTRHALGREGFLEEARKWKEQYGGIILNQVRCMGASLDWSRECFTLDEQRSEAVREAFVRLHSDGLVYQATRLVHWDCSLRTAISDMEVEYLDIKGSTMLDVPGYDAPVEFGTLTSFAYPLEGDLGEIVVATTRLETMLGDTGIAVHPEDERFSRLHGKYAIHPFSGRRLPIVCDGILVDQTLGTGAVKITPAHYPDDFEVGKRHALESINILTDEGLINSNGGSDFEGMPRFEARAAIAKALEQKGLHRGVENHEMRLGVCSRTNDVVEPMMKPQWYVKCAGMAKRALDAVVDENGNQNIEIIPRQYIAEWRRWLENPRDWCISRQLWWGHRVPAWYVTLEEDISQEFGAYTDHWVVGRNEEKARSKANRIFGEKKFQMTQDPDVLDTWFSSGIFPLSALGWPDDTADFRAFYPTSVLETGHDILFFWVARMVMLGLQLTGDVPFRKVYLHPMIRDAHGRKMSKSLGNGIDPLEVINGVTLENLHKRLEESNLDPRELAVAKEGQVKDFPNGIPECGADALRFALVSYTAQSDKINLDIKRVVGYRQWCNKLWNAVRFAMTKLGDNYVPPTGVNLDSLPFSCRWILSVLNKAISKTVAALEAYEFADASTAVYSWWQFQLCDVFIEAIKPYFVGDDDDKCSDERSAARYTLWICLDNGLRLLHPFMPYITEELWQRLPGAAGNCPKKESIMISEYPSAVEEWANEEIEGEIDLVRTLVESFRSTRGKLLGRKPGFVLCQKGSVRDVIRRREFEISTLASLSSFEVLAEKNDAKLATCLVNVVNEQFSTYLEGSLDAEAELGKLLKQKNEVQKQLDTLRNEMSSLKYAEQVPLHIHEKNAKKLDDLSQQLSTIQDNEEKMLARKRLNNRSGGGKSVSP